MSLTSAPTHTAASTAIVEIEFITPTGDVIRQTVDIAAEAQAITAAGIRRLLWGVSSTLNSRPERSLILVQGNVSIQTTLNAATGDHPASLAVALSTGQFIPGALSPEDAAKWEWRPMSPEETIRQYLERLLAANLPRLTAVSADQVNELAGLQPGQEDSYPLMIWKWDCLQPGETAIAYFTRHAADMRAHGRIWHCALEPSWLTTGQAVDYLTQMGGDVSPRTIKRRQLDGDIPAHPYYTVGAGGSGVLIPLISLVQYGREALNLDI